MTVLLADLDYPVPRVSGTAPTLPLVAGRLDGLQDGIRQMVPSLLPHLDGPADIIVCYKADAGGDAPAWSSQVYRFDPVTGAMRRII